MLDLVKHPKVEISRQAEPWKPCEGATQALQILQQLKMLGRLAQLPLDKLALVVGELAVDVSSNQFFV